MGKIENLLTRPPLYFVILGGGLLFYVALPAVIAALCFRGGLVLLAFGVGVVRKDGLRASRVRAFWRSLLTWAPLFILADVGADLLNPVVGHTKTAFLVALMAAGLTTWSTLLPDRGMPDRLSGTRLVPR